MTAFETMEIKRTFISDRLKKVQFPAGLETSFCWEIGKGLGVTGVTVKNYTQGKIKDGYLAEAILSELKRLKLTK